MVGIVIVTHSAKTAEGIYETAIQMAGPDQRIIPAGGAVDGSIGTDAGKIAEAIQAADAGGGVVILADLGSALLSTETAIELLGGELKNRVRIADAPVVEGAVVAAVQASLEAGLEEVLATAESAWFLRKRGDG